MKEDRLKKLCEKFKDMDVLKELEYMFTYPKHGSLSYYDELYLEWLCYAAFKLITEAPICIDLTASIPPTKMIITWDKWVPCSEKPPAKPGWYLCTVAMEIGGWANTFYFSNGKWWDNVRRHMFELYEVRSRLTGELITPEQEQFDWTDYIVAWQPIPEPYKEAEK